MNGTNLSGISPSELRLKWSGHKARMVGWRKALEEQRTALTAGMKLLDDYGMNELSMDLGEALARLATAIEETQILLTKGHAIITAIDIVEQNREVLKNE